MENKVIEAQELVWRGAIPVQIHLHESEVTTVPPPPPALIMAPRIGYLPLLVPQLKPFFSSTLPPGVDTVWFEYKNLPLKWYIPTGVLFDLLCAEPERPWNLTVHFRGYPGNVLTPCEGEDSVKWSFINSLKEAAYIITGNCKNVMNMSQSDQSELWRSILNGNLETYIRVASKLKLGLGGDDFSIKLNSSSLRSRESTNEGETTVPVPTKAGRIPVRLYIRIANEDYDDLEDVPAVDNWDKVSYINRPVEIHGEGKCFTLFDAVRTLLPELFPDKPLADDLVCVPDTEDGQRSPSGEAGNRKSTEETAEKVLDRLGSLSLLDRAEVKLIRIQGVEPKLEIPFAWVANNLMNPEHFIHICVHVKVQELVTL